MKTTHLKQRKNRLMAAVKMVTAILSLLVLNLQAALAQDGNAGISQATSQVKSYFDTGTNLMYAIGAIVGLVGAIKVFKKWNDGEHDTGISVLGQCCLEVKHQ